MAMWRPVRRWIAGSGAGVFDIPSASTLFALDASGVLSANAKQALEQNAAWWESAKSALVGFLA